MKVKFDQVFLDFDEEPLNVRKECVIIDKSGNFVKDKRGMPAVVEKEFPDEKLTLKDVAKQALLFSDSEDITREDKMKRNDLAYKIYKSKKTLELDSDEISLIKDLIDKSYSNPMVVSQACKMLEGKDPLKPMDTK